jgi:hypothetical protein
VSDEAAAPASTRGALRLLLALAGGALLIAGVWVVADNYNADYDCRREIRCHDEANRSPTAMDRLAASLGFGLEPAAARGDPLPGPGGTLLVLAGVALLLAAVLVGPGRPRVRPPAVSATQPLSADEQLARDERLRQRGTITDEEFERRRARLEAQGAAHRSGLETTG